VKSLALGLNQTSRNRIITAIASGIETGANWRQVSDMINVVLKDPYRADLIAITETNRAFNLAAVDTYKLAEIEEWEWMTYGEACDVCSGLNGQKFKVDRLGAANTLLVPPKHPDCRCAVLPVVTSRSTKPFSSASRSACAFSRRAKAGNH
jgi:SPP1 gp7 family putative phage head morphogenesis protein